MEGIPGETLAGILETYEKVQVTVITFINLTDRETKLNITGIVSLFNKGWEIYGQH